MKRVVSSSCIAAMLTFGIVAYAQTTGQNPTGQAGAPTMTSDRQTTGDRTQTQQQMTIVGCIQREADYRQAAGSGRGGALGTGAGVGNEFVLVNASPSTGSQASMSGTGGTSTAATSPTGTSTTPGATAGTTSGTATSGTAGTTGTTATGTATAGTAGTTAGTVSGTASGTTAGTATSGTTAASPGASASATTPMASGGTAYALSGNREKDLEQYVGQRVEIVGTLERGAARSGSGYGGGASGTGTATGTAAGAGTPTSGTPTSGTASGTTSGSASATQRFGDLQQINVVSFRAVGGSCAQ